MSAAPKGAAFFYHNTAIFSWHVQRDRYDEVVKLHAEPSSFLIVQRATRFPEQKARTIPTLPLPSLQALSFSSFVRLSGDVNCPVKVRFP